MGAQLAPGLDPRPRRGDGGGNTLVVVEGIEGRVVPPAAMGSADSIPMDSEE